MMGDQKIQDSATRHLSSSMAVGHIEATPKICMLFYFLPNCDICISAPHCCGISAHAFNQSPPLFFSNLYSWRLLSLFSRGFLEDETSTMI
jgi:hypothetical protein